MAKKDRRTRPKVKPAAITLAEAARRIGVASETAAKLDDLGVFWLGGRRMVGLDRFEKFLADKIGQPAR